MKKGLYLLIIASLVSKISFSQNLIPNGDFEMYSFLPYDLNEFYCSNWYNPTFATSDYLHTEGLASAKLPYAMNESLKVEPYSGKGIIGLVFTDSVGWREYAGVKLKTQLIKDQKYRLSFVYTNGMKNQFATFGVDHMDVLFSNKIVTSVYTTVLKNKPTIEFSGDFWDTTWHQMTQDFFADSAYQYLTIGNFHDPDNTVIKHQNKKIDSEILAYYFFDDFKLIQIPNDDISKLIEMPNVFTPNLDGINEYFKPTIVKIGMNNIEFNILNRWGEKVYEATSLSEGWDGNFNNEPCTNGTYYWKIKYTHANGIIDSFNGFLTLIR